MNIEGRWAIRFEGISVTPSQIGATSWGYGEEPPNAGARDWVDALATQPASIDSTVEPATGEFSLSAFVFELHNLDTVALTFLYQQTTPAGTLNAALTDSATTVLLSRADLENEIVYIGNETILLGVHAGGGSYTTCSRARHGSQAVPHNVGTAFFTRPPSWRGRGVELVSHADSGAAITRWRGLVESISTNEDGTRVRIACRELWASLMGTRTNRGADAIAGHNLVIAVKSSDPDLNGVFGSFRMEPSARKQSLIGSETGAVFAFMQVGDALMLAQETGYQTWRTFFREPLDASGEKLLATAIDTASVPVTQPIYEVFCVHRVFDARLAAIGLDPASATRGYDYPYHPLTIAAVLLFGSTSTTYDYSAFDTATTRWAANFRTLFAADIILDIADLIEQTRGIEVDFFLLGWDGKEDDVLSVVLTRLLRPYGFFLGVTDSGQLTIARFGLADVVAYDAAVGNELDVLTSPLQIAYDSAQGSAIDVIEARVGGRPWKAGRNVRLQASGGDSDRARLGDNQKWTVDYSTLDEGNIDTAITRIIALSQMGVFAMPRLTIRVDDAALTGTNLDHGALVTLADLPINEAYLVDSDGQRISTFAGRADFVGMVIGRKFLVGPRTYEVTILFTNYRTGLERLRCPSMIVDAKAGAVVSSALTSDFGSLGPDAQEFNIGDQVQFYNASDLTPLSSTVYTIQGISGEDVTLDTDPGSVVGQIMELALYSNYTNRPKVQNTSLLVYTFMALGGVLGTSDEAHVYGLSPD
jgi:hypothetical protein